MSGPQNPESGPGGAQKGQNPGQRVDLHRTLATHGIQSIELRLTNSVIRALREGGGSTRTSVELDGGTLTIQPFSEKARAGGGNAFLKRCAFHCEVKELRPVTEVPMVRKWPRFFLLHSLQARSL